MTTRSAQGNAVLRSTPLIATLLLSVLLTIIAQPVGAHTIWDGGCGDTEWSTECVIDGVPTTNWNDNELPDVSKDFFIGLAYPMTTITTGTGYRIAGLISEAPVIIDVAGTGGMFLDSLFAFNAISDLSILNGDVGTNSRLIVRHDSLIQNGGFIEDLDEFGDPFGGEVVNEGILAIEGVAPDPFPNTYFFITSIQNGSFNEPEASVNVSGAGFSTAAYTTIDNNESATWNIIGGASFGGSGDFFTNSGTVNKTGMEEALVSMPVKNLSSGTIDVQEGTLTLVSNDDAVPGPAGEINRFEGGTIQIAPGATLALAQSQPALGISGGKALWTGGTIRDPLPGAAALPADSALTGLPTGGDLHVREGATLDIEVSDDGASEPVLQDINLIAAGHVTIKGIAPLGTRFTIPDSIITIENTGVVTVDQISIEAVGTVDQERIDIDGGIIEFKGNAGIQMPIDVSSSGVVDVTPGATATFFGDVTNNGTVQIGSGASAVFSGNVTGSGSYTGVGTASFESAVSPGSSPGSNDFGGDVVFGPSSTLHIEAQGPSATPVAGTDHDQLNITGNVTLSGTLDIDLLLPGTPPPLGTEFLVMTFADRVGSMFIDIEGSLINTSLALTPIFAETDDALTLRVSIPGDTNLDNAVTVADLAVFALNFGTTPGLYVEATNENSWELGDFNADGAVTVADLSLLALNFGFTLAAEGSVTAATGLSLDAAASLAGIDLAAVPEPASLSLLAIGTATLLRPRTYRKGDLQRRARFPS